MSSPDAPASAPQPLLVLGLGNVLCGDDGLGVEAVVRLTREYVLPPKVEALDGGTLGLSLLGHLAEARHVILVDAVRTDEPPGTLVRLDGEDVAPAVRDRLSVHQVGVADLLDGLRLLDAYPQSMVLLGLVPQSLELGLERTPAVEQNLSALVDRLAAEIGSLGHRLQRSEEGARVAAGMAQEGLGDVETRSGGLWALVGRRAAPGM